MANIKFSQFTQKTTLGTVDFLVGYTGADNVQIDPADLLSDYSQGTGAAGQVTFFSATSTVTGDNNLYWDNTNKRLGIGTATPGNKLEVQVTSNGNGVLFKSNATQIGSILRTAIGGTVSMTVDGAGTRPININNSSSSNVLIANGGGNVGIGTTSPVAKLQVEGSFISSGISQLGTTGANVYLTSSSAGNVGIGDSSPTAKLVVDNVGTKMLELKRSGNIKFRVLADANHGQLNMFNSGTSNTVRLHTSGDSYFNGGNVGIGTTSPSEKLHVQGNVLINGAAPYLSIKTTQTGTPDWKIYNSYNSVGDLAIVGGSSVGNKFNIQPNGNVGIGTTTPLGELHVKDVGAIYTSLSGSDSAVNFVEGGGNPWRIGNRSADDSFRFSQSSSSLGTNVRFIIANGGNVGIGTTSPDTILEVVNDVDNSSNTALDVNAGIIIHNGDSSGTAVLKLRGSGGDSGAVVFGGGGGAASDKFHVISRHNQTKRFTVQANGNVGIGTSSPQAALHVSGPFNTNAPTGNGVLMGLYNNTHGYIHLNGSSGGYIDFSTSGVDHKGRILYDNTSNYLRFDTNGTEKVRITSAGNVGIGTTNPSHLLTLETASSPGLKIKDTTQGATLLAFSQDSNSHIGTFSAHPLVLDTNSAERMRIDSSGNVGIGTTNPETLAHIKVNGGSAQLTLEREGGGAGKAVLAGAAGGLIVYNDAFATKMYVGTSGSYDGNVGIGTISPQYKLDVDGDVQINETLIAKAGADLILQARSSQIVGINSNGTRTMTLDASNNVGIGTSSPASKLEVDGGDIEVDDSASGLILRSPDGTRYRVTVANGGTLSVSAV